MSDRAGVVVGSVASLLFLVVLVGPYAWKPAADVGAYYATGVPHPAVAGVLVLGSAVAILASWRSHVPPVLGSGVAVGLAAFSVLVTATWAVTVRQDVILARGWALPVQRFVLVGLSVLVAFGVAVYAWRLSARR